MKRFIVSALALLSSFIVSAQTQKEIEDYKSRFFNYNTIGTDSALYYTNKIFAATRPIDLAFAYAAKWQLLVVTNHTFNEKEFTDKIDSYLRQVPTTKEYYYELANIYSIQSYTYRLKDDLIKGRQKLLVARKFAELSGDFKQLIKVRSNLSGIIGSLGMKDEAIVEIKAILQLIAEKNTNADAYLDDWRNKNTLNLGVFYIDKFTKSGNKIFLDSASFFLDEMRSFALNEHYQAQVNTKLGIINNLLGNYDKATGYYRQSIAIYTKLKNEKQKDIITYNMGYNFFQQNKYTEARDIFISIIKNKKDTTVDFSYLFAHKYLADIYIKQKNDSAIYYSKTFLALYAAKTEAEKLVFAQSYHEAEKKDLGGAIEALKAEIEALKRKDDTNHRIQYLYIFIIILLIAAAAYLLRLFLKTRKETEARLNELLKKLQENGTEDTPKEFSSQKVTTENERKIIDGLLKLEKERYFLKKEFNLYNTAKKIGSNTAYLTAVIKTYKKMSFNDYTNELRINYILKELMVNEKLQNYTIQSLAEVVGYKNGASFTKIFKQKTGVTPFQFIEKLKTKGTPA